MKQIAIMLTLCFLIGGNLNAETPLIGKWKVVTFEVKGNCGMCKTTIEKSLKNVEGVKFAVWNVDTKKITVKYNPSIINIMDIHKKIATVGYDTSKVKAKDEIYKNLHGCCQYDRG
ncbi:MAG: heavy-metal-associated domain-containing protein [Saprospiraceae bacterium]